jgi:hypothetical protein
MQHKYMLKRIFASYFCILANICFKIFFLKPIFTKLSANFTFNRFVEISTFYSKAGDLNETRIWRAVKNVFI